RALANLGGTYQLLGQFQKALDAYKRSLAIEKTNTAYSNLGTTYFFMGRYQEAAEAFEAAIKLTPNYFQLWANLGDAYRWAPGLNAKANEAYTRAIELCREELTRNPRDPVVHSYLSLCLAKTGRLEEAKEQSREALSTGGKNPEVLYNAAIVATLAHRPQEALGEIGSAAAAGYPVAFIEHEPEFAGLRNEREFQEITRNIKPEKV